MATARCRHLGWFALSLAWPLLSGIAAEPSLLPQAHAHNDYEHPRPLLDALSHGFRSVEADIHLVQGQLLVAHDADQTRPERTLESLYLDPLLDRVRRNGGSVYPATAGVALEFLLLVDLKTEAGPTYQALAQVLPRYQSMLTRFTADATIPGAVTIILSGNRPRELVAAASERYVAIDGRLADLDADPPLHLVPLISDNWRTHFRWDGLSPFPQAERDKLSALVRRAHDQRRLIRFWAIPDRPSAWQALRDAGVDLINTDKLGALAEFLRE